MCMQAGSEQRVSVLGQAAPARLWRMHMLMDCMWVSGGMPQPSVNVPLRWRFSVSRCYVPVTKAPLI